MLIGLLDAELREETQKRLTFKPGEAGFVRLMLCTTAGQSGLNASGARSQGDMGGPNEVEGMLQRFGRVADREKSGERCEAVVFEDGAL